MKRLFKTYNGGKNGNGTYQTIINNIPACKIFIDAMVGNGGIFTNLKTLPETIIINDFDTSIIDKYNFEVPGMIKNNLDVMDLIDLYDYKGSVIDLYDYKGSVFYFDPPYLKETRRSQRDLYKYEWNLEKHKEFIARCSIVKSNCMISHYPCKLYDEAFSKWRKITFLSTTRNGQRMECLYMNFEKPLRLLDYSYLGKDFTDRQRIKRKIKRWGNNLKALPLYERQAIVNQILNL